MLSVIMLAYNRKDLVGRMITDIRSQSFEDFEFIIVDNGSDDGTTDVVDCHAREDARLRVLHIPRSSIGRGRNVGMSSARGEYLTFVDDDDRVDADYLAFLLALAGNGVNDIALCGTDECDEQARVTPQCVFDERLTIGPEEAVRLLLDRKYIRAGLPAKCFRAALLRHHPFKEDCAHEDIFSTYKLLAEARQVAMLGHSKYHILRHETNCSAYTSGGALWTPALLDEYMSAFCERTEFLSRRFPDLAAFARYSEWSYMLSMLEKIARFDLRGCVAQRLHMHAVLNANFAEFFSSPFLKDFEKTWLQQLVKVET